MRTYDDLTEKQLITLHDLAQGGKYSRITPTVRVTDELIRVQCGPYVTEFSIETGDVSCELFNQPVAIKDLYKVVALCKNWGLTY